MNVDVCVQLGLRGATTPIGPTWLDAASMGAASAWAGSYHVLAMGRHYDDYVVTGRILRLPPIPGIPVAHPYERLSGKIRAAGVTGNIGEAVAALVARRFLYAPIADIAHVRPRRPFRRRKAPDYLMRLGPLLPGVFAPVLPPGATFSWPDWWPVESKARTTENGCADARREALAQLTAYWSILVSSRPDLIGFGIIVTLRYWPPREVRASIILPAAQQSLAREFGNTSPNLDVDRIRRHLHAC
jgi:hypothetical protein